MEYEVYNPHEKPIKELPVIYGFNNGGSTGFLSGQLIAEDGETMGNHCCSDEGFMYGDLGIIKGWRDDRHTLFKEKYPDGYRMDFVPYSHVDSHPGLQEAFRRHDLKYKKAKE
jgi:hypothetical protein